MQIENSLKIENLKFKINSRGEIATVLTLISISLMLVGTIVGSKVAQTGPRFLPQAATDYECKNKDPNTPATIATEKGITGGCDCDVDNKQFVRWYKNCAAPCVTTTGDNCPHYYTVTDFWCQQSIICNFPSGNDCQKITCGDLTDIFKNISSDLANQIDPSKELHRYRSSEFYRDSCILTQRFSNFDEVINYCKKTSSSPVANSPTPVPIQGSCNAAGGGCQLDVCTGSTASGDCSLDNFTGYYCCKVVTVATTSKCSSCILNSSSCPSDTVPNGSCSIGDGTGTCCVPKSTSANTPTAAPNKQLCDTCHVVCSEAKTENGGVCESGKTGEKQFCYHECRPDRPGYSQPVYCSGKNAFEIGAIEKDPACGETSGPAPNVGASCEDGKYKHGDIVNNCVEVACDGLNWVEIDNKCLDGQIVKYPGHVLRAGDCNDKDIPKCNGKVVPTQALVNPTKSPNQHGFHIGSEIYTINRDKGVEFQFNVKFYYDGCDGDIQLEQNGNKIAGVNGWNGPSGDYPYSPQWTNSPVLGNGQVQDFTYTGRLVNYHCKDGKAPDNLTDSIKCRLAVDDLGNPRLSGTGCTWRDQGTLVPTGRPTVTPGAANNSAASSGSGTCFPYTCPDPAKGKFSVSGGKLYDSDRCRGNPISYTTLCGGNSKNSLCEFAGGLCKLPGNNTEIPSYQTACKALGNGYSGKGYKNWGPDNNQVSSPACGSDQICCEPNNNGNGFLPVQQPPINQQPGGNNASVINGTNCSLHVPPTIYKNIPFNVSVDSATYNLVDSVMLHLDNGNFIKDKPASVVRHDGKAPGDADYNAQTWTTTTWDFNDISLDEAKPYDVTMTFKENGVNKDCGQKFEINVSSASPTPTPTLNGATASGCSLAPAFIKRSSDPDRLGVNWPDCISCIYPDKFQSEIDSNYPPTDTKYKSCTPLTKVVEWCATTPDCISKILQRNTCLARCTNSQNKTPIQPLSYSNAGFQAFIDGIKKGIFNVIQASLYVLNATRAPGLQIQYCNPLKGFCNFSSQIKT